MRILFSVIDILYFLISNYHPHPPSGRQTGSNVICSIFAMASGKLLPAAMSGPFRVNCQHFKEDRSVLLARCNAASSEEAEIQRSLFKPDDHRSSLLLPPSPPTPCLSPGKPIVSPFFLQPSFTNLPDLCCLLRNEKEIFLFSPIHPLKVTVLKYKPSNVN